MFNLLVYGSLIERTELRKHGISSSQTSSVAVRGFRRSFNQEPIWRQGVGRARAVLGVEERSGASFNAILVTGLQERELESLDQRERGYERRTLDRSRLTGFLKSRLPELSGETFLYCSRPEQRNDSLLPHAVYFELCLRGAGQWGADFRRAFLASTFIGERTAGEFLAAQQDARELRVD